ncbi:MAG: PfkB family carbohydrate kinase [Acidimicrobiales bacterium]
MKVATIGEILVEVMAVERGRGFLEPLTLKGPFPSGAPTIFIDQVAKLGQPCAIVSCVGDDDFGRLNISRLEHDGVDTAAVEVLAGEVTGSAFVRYGERGGRDFVFNVARSASGRIRSNEASMRVIAGCQHLHISGSTLASEGPARFVLSAAEQLKARGGTVSFDPNVRVELARDPVVLAKLKAALAYTDVFLPSGPELTLLTVAEDEQGAMEELVGHGVTCVAVKRGAQGSTWHEKGHSFSVPSFVVAEVDPTGAGDCFDAAFVTCWLRGKSPRETLELANAAGARAVGVLGPMEGTSTWAELEEMRSRGTSPPTRGSRGGVRAARRARRLDDWVGLHTGELAPAGLTSVCSARELVLEAAMLQAAEEGTAVLVEATCNQVNHQGGYTGLTPATFHDQVRSIADRLGFPGERVMLGGDHLGPNPWRRQPSERALAEAEQMVAAYVSAGYEKIHLDTSMGCEGEPAHLGDELTAGRAARLAVAAERAAEVAGAAPPRYVIGTEVPVPGGVRGEAEGVHVTSREAVLATLEAHRRAFARAGAAAAFQRVIAVVAHPGVEFDNQRVFVYQPERAKELTGTLGEMPGLVFEAHSTDYQPGASLARLVADGFAVLKVGPALTFALREALYGLDAIACWTVPGWSGHTLAGVVEEEMLAHPEHWSGYYPGSPALQHRLRHFSYSDRARYYWASPALREAVASLLAQLGPEEVPETLVSQYLPKLYDRVAGGALPAMPRTLVLQAVRDVLRPYGAACGLPRAEPAEPAEPAGQ